MKWIKRKRAAAGSTDIVQLLATALAQQHAASTVTVDGEPAARPEPVSEEEFRAQAQSMLYDFAMQHFTSQVELLRREAVIEHLANNARDRMSFFRLAAIGTCASLMTLGGIELGTRVVRHLGIDMNMIASLAKPIAESIRAFAGT